MKVRNKLVALVLFCMSLTACLTTPDSIAQKVGAAYGDPHAKVLSAVNSTTDGFSHQDMYLITLQGNFSKGRLKASELSFSALADGSKIWAIDAKNKRDLDVWQENQLPN